ncbi:MAG: group I intron-associated PD-(D/E)XK endonuclease [Actinomycetota bacterium]
MAADERLFPFGGEPHRVTVTTAARPHTKTVGDQTEAMVMARLLQVYPAVLLPFGENQRYDLVVDDGEKFLKIQCKTGRLQAGAISFPVCSTSYLTRADGARPRHVPYEDAVDAFGVYCPETDSVYLVPVSEVGARACSLRVDPPRNNQSKKVRWASDFEVVPPG